MKGKLTRKMLRRRNRRFYTIYFSVVAVVLIAFAAGTCYLLGELREYEDTRNIYTAQKVFEMFENGDYESLYAYETDQSAEDAGQYARTMRQLAEGGQLGLTERAEAGAYYVTLDGRKFAELNLKPIEGQTSPKGYFLWELDTIHALTLPSVTYRIQAREDYTVLCDGQPLTEADKVETGISTGLEEYLQGKAEAPTLCVYEITRTFGEAEFSCVDHRGRSVDLTDDGSGMLVAGQNYDSVDDELKTYIIKTAKCLALYTADDVDIYEMNKYVLKDSDAYKTIRALERGWFTLHTARRFENSSMENLQMFGENVLSCDVNLTFIITAKKNNEEKSYPMSYTFYFVKSGGNWLLYNMLAR